jgi:hypothetical protein
MIDWKNIKSLEYREIKDSQEEYLKNFEIELEKNGADLKYYFKLFK